MKLTLLDMTQTILSSLDSDEVNSISDTPESKQVAEVIKTSFFNIITRANLPEQNTLFSLDASGDADLPVLMYKPANVSRIDWIKYDTNISTDTDRSPTYQYVTIVPVSQFIDLVSGYDLNDTDVGTYTFNQYTLSFKSNDRPTYCTIIKDYNILFNAFDSEVDTTLQESKTMCHGLVVPTFLMEDDFIPELDDNQFPLLLNEAKSLAFLELKQMMHEKAERETRRQWVTLQKNKNLNDLSHFDQLPNFSRRSGRWGFSRSIRP